MKRLLEIILGILIVGIGIYLDGQLFCGAATIVVFCSILLCFLLPSKITDYLEYEWEGFLGLMGICLLIISFTHFTIGLRVNHTRHGITINDTFYPFAGTCWHGNKLDTIEVRKGFKQYYSKTTLLVDKMFLLHQNDKELLFSRIGMVLEGRHINIVEQEYKYGAINLIHFVDTYGEPQLTDAFGTYVDATYRPVTIDITPDYSINP